jgi:hypothetical protein
MQERYGEPTSVFDCVTRTAALGASRQSRAATVVYDAGMSVTREKLYAEVWTDPMTTVAERYEVSSNYLARICERLKVPRPPRGYWQQRAVGRAESLPALPGLDPGDEAEWVRGVEPYQRHPPRPTFTSIEKRETRRPERPKLHPLVAGVRQDFEDSKVSSFRDDGYLKPKKHALVDLFVSKEMLASALKIANQIFLGLEDQGFWVRMAPQGINYRARDLDYGAERPRYDPYASRSWGPSQETLVFVGGVAIGLTLFEIAEKADTVSEDGRFVRAPTTRAFERLKEREPWRVHRADLPSGKLGILAYSPYASVTWSKYWRETNGGELLEMAGDIANDLERAAPEIVRLYEEAERRAEEQHRKWEAERLERARLETQRREAEEEEARRKTMRETIKDWRMARDIRAYVDEVKALAKEAELSVVQGGPVDAELQWAVAYADEVDPMTAWRKDMANAKAGRSGEPCPECGERHGPATADQPLSAEGKPVALAAEQPGKPSDRDVPEQAGAPAPE